MNREAAQLGGFFDWDSRVLVVVRGHSLSYAAQLKILPCIGVACKNLVGGKMSIMSAYAQSDARGVAWLLAATAKKCLEDQDSARDLGYSLNNAYRLLETYRSKAFASASEAPSPYSGNAMETSSLIPLYEQHISEVRSAVGQALVAVFGADRQDDAIDRIETVLRAAAYPSKFAAQQDDKDMTLKFFDSLLDRLQMR